MTKHFPPDSGRVNCRFTTDTAMKIIRKKALLYCGLIFLTNVVCPQLRGAELEDIITLTQKHRLVVKYQSTSQNEGRFVLTSPANGGEFLLLYNIYPDADSADSSYSSYSSSIPVGEREPPFAIGEKTTFASGDGTWTIISKCGDVVLSVSGVKNASLAIGKELAEALAKILASSTWTPPAKSEVR